MSEPLSAAKLRRLQKMIDRTARASSAFHRAQEELNNWCLRHYGFEPGDVDADQIIDSVLGGCGLCNGMPAAEFDGVMRESTP